MLKVKHIVAREPWTLESKVNEFLASTSAYIEKIDYAVCPWHADGFGGVEYACFIVYVAG